MRKIILLLGIIAIPLMTMATEPEKKAGKETGKVEKSEKKGCSSSEKEQSSRCCAGKKPA
ncbi:MAG: hypothetical protein ACK4KT_00545 [Thermaurantimonas sp.]